MGSMEGVESIDQVLGAIASGGMKGAAADALLDFREAVMKRRHAGDCLRCYFKILSYCGGPSFSRVTPLRQWLETHLELVASAPEAGELERLPVRLESSELKGFCESVMQRLREDRDYPYCRIELAVGFRDPLSAA